MARFTATVLGTAAFAMIAATPAVGADVPGSGLTGRGIAPLSAMGGFTNTGGPFSFETGAADEAEWYGRCGWRGCYRGRRGGVRTGDVLAGVLAIGGIAAIASAASRNRSRERVVMRAPQPARADNQRDQPGTMGSGMSGAVDMCVAQINRGNTRSTSVDNASRTGDGWRVSGSLDQGGGWNCWIDNDGRIRQIDFGTGQAVDSGGAANRARVNNLAANAYPANGDRAGADLQWSDDAYASARASLQEEAEFARANDDFAEDGDLTDSEQFAFDDRPDVPLVDADLDPDAPMPAYPGGPFPGEEGYEEAMAERNQALD